MSLTAKLLGIRPAWSDDPAPEVVINPSGSVSSRRPYPVAKNDRFVPTPVNAKMLAPLNIGEGNDIYREPGDDETEIAWGIKRIRNVGGGAQVLVEQEEGDPDNKLRTHKPEPGSLVSITMNEEEVLHGTTGVTSFAAINIDGIVQTVGGVVSVLNEGRRGGTSSVAFVSCDGSPLYTLEWVAGQILNDGPGQVITVGDCTGTPTPGP